MIAEDYCSYEVSKLLKENGFPIDEHLYMYINKDGKLMTDHQACITLTNDEYRTFFDDYIPTITHQMAMKWLREVHNINIDIVSIWNQQRWEYQIFIITPATSKYPYIDDTLYMGYEEAVEAALKYYLTEILKINNI